MPWLTVLAKDTGVPPWSMPDRHATLLVMTSDSRAIGWTALVLAGGRSSRLGNQDKAAITIGGVSGLDRLLSSLPPGVPIVVAGPERPTPRPVTFRREQPIFGGPAAGIASGLGAVSTPIAVLLAVDMPWAGELVEHLIAEFGTCDRAALVPVDRSGFRQPLCAVVRSEALRAALVELGDPAGRSLWDLMSLLDVQERPLGEDEMRWVHDIDTPEDLREARSMAARLGWRHPHPEPTSPPSSNLECSHDEDLGRRRMRRA